MLSDKAGLLKLQEGVEKKLDENRIQNKKILEHKKRYETLEERLSTLPDKISHQVMIPFTTKAFMPGKLIHTNEIQVLLGENYFIECSAKHAKEICGRRKAECDKMMKELEKELELVEGWRTQTNQFRLDKDNCKEITEHYSEQQLDDWRKKHKDSMLKERQKEKEETEKRRKSEKIETDEELWARLEELEVREALEKEWEKEEGDSCTEESESDSENEANQDEGYQEPEKPVILVDNDPDGSNKQALKRRVSFAAAACDEQSSNEIRFTFSTNESEKETNSLLAEHPGDINNLGDQDSGDTNVPKSILKIPSDYEASDHIIPEPEPVRPKHPSEPFINPVCQLVQESEIKSSNNLTEKSSKIEVEQSINQSVIENTEDTPPAEKRVSRFKAMRAKQKS